MTRVAIVTPHVTTGDAVCNDVFGMSDVLRRRGLETRIYGADWTVKDPELKVWPVSNISAFLRSSTDLLIYHHSMGWETGIELLQEVSCRKVIKYHNVTPPKFFVGWSEEYESVCQAGRDQIKAIAGAECDLYLSASEYNKCELISEGAAESRSFVVPPFHQVDVLFRVEPDFEIIDRYRDGKATLLMVGSLFPNKGHASLLEMFATYYHDYNHDSRLFLVGKESKSLRTYSSYLRELAAHFELGDDVIFTGLVSEDALKSYYLMANLFVTASEHEGFCVPLIESMAMKIPIIALGSSAIPETVGNAGLVWDEGNPSLFAESIDTLINDESIMSRVGHAGRKRYEERFTNEKIEQRFLSALGEFL
jgi:glycosyltransferase involved in cell wall biosynthesis